MTSDKAKKQRYVVQVDGETRAKLLRHYTKTGQYMAQTVKKAVDDYLERQADDRRPDAG